MAKPTTKGTFKELRAVHPLFVALSKMPKWWVNIINDPELYVEVRKDNYVNIYYYGGNVAKVYWDGEIKAETHHKYHGKPEPKSSNKYLDSTNVITSSKGLADLKKLIAQVYLKESSADSRNEIRKVAISSEKQIQGCMRLGKSPLYIDSEFAYRYNAGGHTTMRIDLVELRGSELVFVELKRIDDGRLRSSDNNPEILEQMATYDDFVKTYEADLKDYYSTLLQIKKSIGLIPSVPEISGVSLTPELIIANTYTKQTKGRMERIEAIKNVLTKAGITFQMPIVGEISLK